MTIANFKTSLGYDVANSAEQGASIRPSLLLNFAKTKRLDPRITFTRSSIATYFDSNGILKSVASGVPRFDHNPETKKSLGLLIEESSTNYVLQSDDVSISTSLLNCTVTGNNAVSPEGISNAATVLASAGDVQHGVQKSSSSIPASTTCTLSAFVKAGTHRYTRVDTANIGNWSTNAGVSVDLLTGEIIAGSGTVKAIGNGWYRISIQGVTNSSSGVSRGIWVWAAGSNGNSTFNAAGTETILVFGLQIEDKPFITSYIPTVAASVTRNADAASMTGTNFSSWFNAAEGTMYADYVAGGSSNRPVFTTRATSTADNRIQFASSATNVLVNGVSQANIGSGTNITSGKQACAYKLNDFAGIIQGIPVSTNVGTDTSGAVPVVNYATIGYFDFGGADRLNGTIKKIAYYPRRLTNTELQTLTRE